MLKSVACVNIPIMGDSAGRYRAFSLWSYTINGFFHAMTELTPIPGLINMGIDNIPVCHAYDFDRTFGSSFSWIICRVLKGPGFCCSNGSGIQVLRNMAFDVFHLSDEGRGPHPEL